MSRGFGPAELLPPRFGWGIRSVLPTTLLNISYGQLGDKRPVIFGGSNNAMQFDGFPQPPSSATFVFAADGLSFTTGGVFPYPDIYSAAAAVLGDGRLLVVGRVPGPPGTDLVVCTLDPISLNWTTQLSPTDPYDVNPNQGGLVTLATGNALFIGSGAGFIAEYDYLLDTWAARANPLSAFLNNPKGLTLSNGEVLVSDFGAVPQIYAPSSNTWHAPVTVPQATNYCESMVNLPNGLAFTTNSLSFNFVSDCYDPVARKFFPRAGLPNAHNGSLFKPPNAYYMGEGLVAIVNPSYAPRVAFYSYFKNKWYGGGFDGSIESGYNEPLQFSAHFYLGQYGFLLVGDEYYQREQVPHRAGFYSQLSTEKVNDGHTPSFSPSITVVPGKASDRVFVTWNPASDPKAVADDLIYYVFAGIGSVDFGSSYANTEIWPGTLSREIIGLATGSTYKFGVRARNFVAKNAFGNTETNIVESTGLLIAVPPTPTFAWVPAPSMSQPRKWLNGIYKADGRFLVCGGISDIQYSNGDIYSQTGLTVLPSPNGPGARGAATIDESPEGFNGTFRPTSLGGSYIPYGPINVNGGARYYPYIESWFNPGNFEYGSNIQDASIGVEELAAIAIPGTYGDLLRIGGRTEVDSPSTAVAVVERLSYLPRKIDYRGPYTAFTIGTVVTDAYNSAQGTILADTGLTLVLLVTVSADWENEAYVIGETVVGQTSGAYGTVQSKGKYDGCLYLSGVVGTFVVGEELIGSGVGHSISVTFIEEPIGTLTIDPIGDTPFVSYSNINDYQWYNPPIYDTVTGSAFAINFPQYSVIPRYVFEPLHEFQNWRVVAPMNVPRCRHSVMLFQSGKILVVGGENADGTAEQSAEVYDPVADTWTLIPQSIVLPYDTITTPFTLGELVTGDDSLSTGVVYRMIPGFLILKNVVGAFNHSPVENLSGSLGGSASTTGIAEHDYIGYHVKAPLILPFLGEVWALGGNSDVVDIFDEDITYGAIVSKGVPLPSSKYGHTAHMMGEYPGWHRVVIFGGSDTKEVWSLDLDTPGSWMAETDMLEARTGHVSFLLANNKILVAGGEDGSGTPLSTAELSS